MIRGAKAGRALAAALRGLRRPLSAADAFWCGVVETLAVELLDDAGARSFVDALWTSNGVYGPERPLFSWEREWFERAMPTPPAKILVGGAGRGREVRWLAERGFEVHAFDPVADFVAELGRSGATSWSLLSYEDLCSPLEERVRAAAPYDAYLLGWGSFSLVRGRGRRREVLSVARQLVPHGPVLVSCIRLGRRPSRARSAGNALAARLVRGRGRQGDGDSVLLPGLGFVHSYAEGELEELAAQTGGRLAEPVADDTEFPHAAIVPQ